MKDKWRTIYVCIAVIFVTLLGVKYMVSINADNEEAFVSIETSSVTSDIISATLEPAVAEKTEEPYQEPYQESAPVKIKVHVIGAVVHPGVYELVLGSRTEDAVNSAGGFTSEADKESINLSQYVYDTQQIKIYKSGEKEEAIENGEYIEVDDNPALNSPVAKPENNSARANVNAGDNIAVDNNGKININTASKDTLITLPGIGEVIAGYIIEYRDKNGGFKSIEGLKEVQRIGDKVFEGLKDLITI